MPCQPVSRLTKQLTKHCTKRFLEYKNKAVSHTSFVQRPTCLVANTIYVLYPYVCIIHVLIYVIYVRLRYYMFYLFIK